MSAFDFIRQPLETIRSYLREKNCELVPSKHQDVYLVKFTPQTNVRDPLINPIKGLIFNHATGQIISMTYPVPIEFKDLSIEDQKQAIDSIDKSLYTVHEAMDGTLFRYAYFPEQKQWILSTNNKEDADNAFWMNGISLAKQFHSVKTVKIDYESFDKNHVHLFILCHPLNVIVVNHEESKIYHVATYDRTTMKEIDHDLGIPKPPLLDSTVRQIERKIQEAQEKPVTSAGYIITIMNGEKGLRYRFENVNYTYAKQLRGNSNNLNFTMLSLYASNGEAAINEFLQYYPIYKGEYTALITRINKLTAKFYQEYGRRYKDHQTIKVHPRHHSFLEMIHQILFKDTLKAIGKTVQYEDIRKFVMNQPPAKLLFLLNYEFDNVTK